MTGQTGNTGTTYNLNTPGASDPLSVYVINTGLNSISTLGGYGLSGGVGVNAFAFASNGLLYIGGNFTGVGFGGTAITGLNYIARYNPTSSTINGVSANSFAPLAGYGLNNTVNALALDSSGKLYIGGSFTAVGTGGTTVSGLNRMAIYDPSTDTFAALNKGLGSSVYALVFASNGMLYIGGSFSGIPPIGTLYTGSLNYVAKYNPTLSTLDGIQSGYFAALAGFGLNNTVNILTFASNGLLYIGGGFTGVGSGGTTITGLNRIAKYNPSTSITIGGVSANSFAALAGYGLNNTVNALALDSNGKLYIGGSFTAVGSGGTSVPGLNYIATYDPSTDLLSSLNKDKGVGGNINTIRFDNNGLLYVGGSFTYIYVTENINGLNCIAVYNPTSSTINNVPANSFAPIAGYGLNTSVSAFALDSNGKLYIGGTFTNTGPGGFFVFGISNVATYNPNIPLSIVYNSNLITQLYQYGQMAFLFFSNGTWNY